MLGQVDAHGLGGYLILTDGLEGAPVAGVDEQHYEEDAQRRDGKDRKGGQAQHHLPVSIGDVEIVKRGEVVERVGAVGYAAEVVPLEHGADYLAEAQRGYGKVVALELEHRQADKPGDEGGHQSGDDNGDQHAEHEAGRAAHPAAAEEVLQVSVMEKLMAEPSYR